MKAPRDRSGRESEPGALLEVAVALPVADVFTYRDLPREGRLPLGSQVVVPFRGRKVTGFVVGHPEAIPPDAPEKIRPILAVVGDSHFFLSLAREISQRFAASSASAFSPVPSVRHS